MLRTESRTIVILVISLYLFVLLTRQNLCKENFFNIFQRQREPKKQVSEMLEEIKRRIDILVKYSLENNYPDKPRAELMSKRWKKVKVSETLRGESDIAYLVNKDEELKVCLRDPQTDEAEALNTAMFVVLHELGHLMSSKYGHGVEFWNNFKLLLKKAIELEIYDYENYNKRSQKYCGIDIYSHPCTDSTCKN